MVLGNDECIEPGTRLLKARGNYDVGIIFLYLEDVMFTGNRPSGIIRVVREDDRRPGDVMHYCTFYRDKFDRIDPVTSEDPIEDSDVKEIWW